MIEVIEANMSRLTPELVDRLQAVVDRARTFFLVNELKDDQMDNDFLDMLPLDQYRAVQSCTPVVQRVMNAAEECSRDLCQSPVPLLAVASCPARKSLALKHAEPEAREAIDKFDGRGYMGAPAPI